MNSLLQKHLNFNRQFKINFDGGDLTSDAGLLLYKEFDEKIGFSKLIKIYLNLMDNAKFRIHSNVDIILQKIYQHIAGYHGDDDADELRNEPVFKAILNKKSLASQPTISRLNNRLNIDTIKQLEKINEKLMDIIYSIKMPEHILLDLDSTNCATYGDQYGAKYNSHYRANGFHPLVAFDGLTGDFIKAELRAGNVYTSRNVVSFLGPVISRYKNKYEKTTRVVRADSGFAMPRLYELLEDNDTLYAIRSKAYKTLYTLAKGITEEMDILTSKNILDYKVVYGEFLYEAKGWGEKRRVVVKIEKPEGQMVYNYTFIVTNMTSSPEDVIRFYSKRGTMENFIKESKNGFGFKTLSSTQYIANANKLQISLLAYNFNNWFRRIALTPTMQSNRIETIRLKMVKIAARITNSGRYLTFKLCSSCPYKKQFWDTLNRIANISGFV